MRRPRYRQWVHAILVLQKVRGIETVFPPGSRHDAIVRPISFPMTLTQFPKLPFSLLPVNALTLAFGKVARIADTRRVKVDRLFLGFLSVFVLHSRVRALIGDHALLAVKDFLWKTIQRLGIVITSRKRREVC